MTSEAEEVENLVQALINFADLDTPLENPSATEEREPNWRKETRTDEEIKGDPKYVPYEEERFKKVWEELELSLNPYYEKMKQKEKDELIKTIKKYLHVWAENLAPMEGSQHHINTGEEIPVKQRQYKLGVDEREAVKKWVREMTEAGLIQESNSPWCSPLLCVRKPDGSFRICMDARKLNEFIQVHTIPIKIYLKKYTQYI